MLNLSNAPLKLFYVRFAAYSLYRVTPWWVKNVTVDLNQHSKMFFPALLPLAYELNSSVNRLYT